MMAQENFWLILLSGLWLGILTSISPCPLATNLAAISYTSRSLKKPFFVFLTGISYSFGRLIAYILVALIILYGVSSIPSLSFALQKYMHLLLGPFLILVGMVLIELIHFPVFSLSFNDKLQEHFKEGNPLAALPLGFVFALAFCPVSAALFFGSLIPLAISSQSFVVLPALYGFGTALPVILFSILFVLGSGTVARYFNRLTETEKWLRLGTGIVIIFVGVYFCLTTIFKAF